MTEQPTDVSELIDAIDAVIARCKALGEQHAALIAEARASLAAAASEPVPYQLVDPTPARRTKRRYAHELYPHAGETETRPLDVEVPYLWARYVGFNILGTSWHEVEPRSAAGARVQEWRDAGRIAALADALQRGVTGDEAWAWADGLLTDDMEPAWERACAVLGDDVIRSIKPYPCGPEPAHHYHDGERNPRGWTPSILIRIPESVCPECTEPIEALTPEATPS